MDNYEAVGIGEMLEFKRGLRLAQTKGQERDWLATFLYEIRQGATIHDAVWAGIEEWDL